jgi:2-methylcitrate dehydratase PrpD
MYIEDALGDWTESLRWHDIPDAIRDIARTCVLDGLSVGLAGSRTDAYVLAARAINELTGSSPGNCTVLGSPARTVPAAAAWLNGVAMHALDFDDTSYAGILHATAAILPAAMAVTEHMHGDFEDLLTAYIAGVEVELAVGTALGDCLYAKGHWTTTALGVVGSAAASAKALRLSAAQTANAIRLAFNTSIGTRSVHGSFGKPYLCGVAARLGVEAAYAARAGLNAGPDTLAGRYGYAAVANDGKLDLKAFQSLGKPFRIAEPGMALKMHPVCSAGQAAIQAVLELQNEFAINADDVVRAHVYATELVVSCLIHSRPQAATQAQFSMQFAVSTALLRRGLGIEHLDSDWIKSETLQSYLQRVSLYEDKDLVAPEDLIQHPEAARVVLELADGRQLERTVLAARGMPINPLDRQEAAAKFISCASQVYPQSEANGLYRELQSATKGTLLSELLQRTSCSERSGP